MALQSPFFGKREPDQPGRSTPSSALQPSAQRAGHTAAAVTSTAAPTSAATTAPAGSDARPAPVVVGESAPSRPSAESLLKVGPLIRLKGVEITDCDTLFVEGTVEATMDSRVMEIAPPGRFKGSAEIDLADIHGHFEGTLTVRDRLVIHPTGRVTGTVRYGKLSIAEGGQLSGDVGVLGDAPARPTAATVTPA